MGTAHGEQLTVIASWVLLRIRNVSHKSCTDNHNIHFMVNNFFLIMPVWEKWKNMVQPDSPKWQYNTAHERCDLNPEQLSQKHTHINMSIISFP